MPVVAKDTPASQAPYSASERACMSPGARTTRGKAAAMARMPSSACSELIGFPSAAYRASTQWAIAFMPLAAEIATGRPRVSAGS